MLKDKTLTQGIDRLPLETENSKKKKTTEDCTIFTCILISEYFTFLTFFCGHFHVNTKE